MNRFFAFFLLSFIVHIAIGAMLVYRIGGFGEKDNIDLLSPSSAEEKTIEDVEENTKNVPTSPPPLAQPPVKKAVKQAPAPKTKKTVTPKTVKKAPAPKTKKTAEQKATETTKTAKTAEQKATETPKTAKTAEQKATETAEQKATETTETEKTAEKKATETAETAKTAEKKATETTEQKATETTETAKTAEKKATETAETEKTAEKKATETAETEKTAEQKATETTEKEKTAEQKTAEIAKKATTAKTAKEPALKQSQNKKTEPVKASKAGATTSSALSAKKFRTHKQLKQRKGNKAPTYPKSALKKKWEGRVEVMYYVNSAGFVEKIQLNKSSGYSALDNSALRALARYRYHPGQEGWVTHPVEFLLEWDKEVKETAPLGGFPKRKGASVK